MSFGQNVDCLMTRIQQTAIQIIRGGCGLEIAATIIYSGPNLRLTIEEDPCVFDPSAFRTRKL